MGNEGLCSKDTRIENPDFFCGKQSQFRNSTAIQIVGQIPVISGPPLNFNKQQTFKKVEKSAVQFCEINDLDDSLIPVVSRIIAYGHMNIFKAYELLPMENQETFLEEIRFLQFDFLDSIYHNYILNQKKIPNNVTLPPNLINKSSISEKQKLAYCSLGLQQIQNRKVGYLIMCAGSSSRFNCQQKFLISLELKNNKCLLEIMLGRIRRNSKIREGQIANIPILIACNKHNRIIIEKFLKEKKYCGFEPTKIRYMIVNQIPVLDKRGKICLSFEYKVIERPGGTAKCIQQLFNTPIYYNFLKSEGAEYLQVIGCENLAQNPGDPFNFGYLIANKLQLLGKCVNADYPTQQFPRYIGSKDKKILLAGTEEILRSNISEENMQTILTKSPICLNFLVFRLDTLKVLTKNYENSLFLSHEFRTIERCQNYFDFQKQRPSINQSVVVFEKDIGHLMTCSRNCHLLKVARQNFIPLISKNQEYPMKEACQKFLSAQERALSYSSQHSHSSF